MSTRGQVASSETRELSARQLNQPLVLLFLTSSANGTLSLPVAIVPTAQVQGLVVYFQYGVADPVAAGGIAVTGGAGVRL